MSVGRLDDGPAWFAKALAQQRERFRVDVDGVGIEAHAWGERGAPGVLLLHGFRGHADWWAHVAPLLAEGHRVIALSWSGMGESDWREEGYTLDLYADEAVAVAQADGLLDAESPPVVVGHSFGGHVAALIAARDGLTLAGTILVDVRLGPVPRGTPADPARRFYATRAEAIDKFRFVPAQDAEPFIRRNIAEQGLISTTDELGVEGWCWRFDPRLSAKLAWRHAWESLSRPRCPLAFVRGACSGVITRELEAAQKAQAPCGSAFITIPEAGHHVMADQPLALVVALRAVIAMWAAAGKEYGSEGRAGSTTEQKLQGRCFA